jgi:hypothetical protein
MDTDEHRWEKERKLHFPGKLLLNLTHLKFSFLSKTGLSEIRFPSPKSVFICVHLWLILCPYAETDD